MRESNLVWFLITDSGGNPWCHWYIIRIGTLPQSWILLARRNQSVSHWRSLEVIGDDWGSLWTYWIQIPWCDCKRQICICPSYKAVLDFQFVLTFRKGNFLKEKTLCLFRSCFVLCLNASKKILVHVKRRIKGQIHFIKKCMIYSQLCAYILKM